MNTGDYHSREVWKLATSIAVSCFIYCFGLVSMNSLTENIAETLHWGDSPIFLSIFTTLYPLGIMIGTVFGSSISSKFGIRTTIISSNIINIFASFLTIIPTNITFGSGRLITGFIGGIFITVTSVFINEMTPDPMTGAVGTLVSQACSSSFVVSYFFAIFAPTEDLSSTNLNYIWMAILGFPIFFSLYQIYYFTLVFKYENPGWLLKHGRKEEARKALLFVYKEHAVEVGMTRLKNHCFGNDVEEGLVSEHPSFRDMFCKRKYRKMMRNSLAMNIGQQTMGSSIVMMYSSSMFEVMGGGVSFSRGMTLVVGILAFISGLSAIVLIHWVGRKTILVVGTLGCTVCLVGLGFVTEKFDGEVWLKCSLIFIYISVFSVSMGATFWTYIGETCNGKALGVGLTFGFVAINILSFGFPIVEYYFGISVCFYILSGLSFVLAIYQMIDLIETRGLTKAEIHNKIYS